jgi:cell fate (sporulation/competence/biofilm development) regulator YlbF (YheA/YmcA/DUF963 family)
MSFYKTYIYYTGHAYRSITDTMEVEKIEKKGKHLNTLEKYHTFKMSENRLHINDTYIDINNPIFEALHELDTR